MRNNYEWDGYHWIDEDDKDFCWADPDKCRRCRTKYVVWNDEGLCSACSPDDPKWEDLREAAIAANLPRPDGPLGTYCKPSLAVGG